MMGTMKMFAVCMLVLYLCLGALAAFFGFSARDTSNTRVSPHFSLEPYFLLFLFLSSCHKIFHIFSRFCLLLGFYENNEWLWNCAGISCPTCRGHLHLPGQSSTSHWASCWARLTGGSNTSHCNLRVLMSLEQQDARERLECDHGWAWLHSWLVRF